MKTPTPLFLQEHDYTCGPACIRMAAARFGIKRNEAYFEKLLKTTKTFGTETAYMRKGARSLGFDVEERERIPFNEVKRYIRLGYTPIVLYFYVKKEEGHYAVVKHISRTRISLIDPYRGSRHSYSLSYFRKIWHGKDEEKNGWVLFLKKETK